MKVQVRMMKEERGRVEGALEEARSREMEQRSRADAVKQELEVQRTQAQRHLTQVSHSQLHAKISTRQISWAGSNVSIISNVIACCSTLHVLMLRSTYLAHHELESVLVMFIFIIIIMMLRSR